MKSLDDLMTHFSLSFCHPAEEEGATPVKRRRMSSDDDRPAEGTSAGTGASLPPCAPSTSASTLPPCAELKPEPPEALTPASTSDTETRDSSSLIDPGTEHDPPSPDPAVAAAANHNNNTKIAKEGTNRKQNKQKQS